VARVPDKQQRLSVAAQSRDPAPHGLQSTAWAPALQRTVEGTLRCVRGTRAERAIALYAVIASAEAIQSLSAEGFWIASLRSQ